MISLKHLSKNKIFDYIQIGKKYYFLYKKGDNFHYRIIIGSRDKGDKVARGFYKISPSELAKMPYKTVESIKDNVNGFEIGRKIIKAIPIDPIDATMGVHDWHEVKYSGKFETIKSLTESLGSSENTKDFTDFIEIDKEVSKATDLGNLLVTNKFTTTETVYFPLSLIREPLGKLMSIRKGGYFASWMFKYGDVVYRKDANWPDVKPLIEMIGKDLIADKFKVTKKDLPRINELMEENKNVSNDVEFSHLNFIENGMMMAANTAFVTTIPCVSHRLFSIHTKIDVLGSFFKEHINEPIIVYSNGEQIMFKTKGSLVALGRLKKTATR